MRPGPRTLVGMLGAGIVLAACAGPERPAETRVEGNVPGGSAETVTGGTYKVGVPYKINGKWYEPHVDYDHTETGIASWYGRKFDGRRTANGEIFDSTKLTAAHRTLPLPSMVRVTNLENGRVVKLRVNDRGPFARDRILDVTRRAARLLGFKDEGTTRVRVEVLEDESRRMAAAAKQREGGTRVAAAEPGVVSGGDGGGSTEGGGATNGTTDGSTGSGAAANTDLDVQRASTAPDAVRTGAAGDQGRTLSVKAWSDGTERPDNLAAADLFVQAGAFVREANAERIRGRLERLGEPFIAEAVIDGQRFYRVRFGPLGGVSAVNRLLDQLAGAGVPTAEVVIR
ncbi:rare lipoprotein A [Limimonas halophila]|uniref:Endolytic peptidoglycan transglycosylase RlpA n=1 Tax=Limimonas halophila TaxID=1082479 RepID=A0A1G7NKB7_9PROT|nr:septal ring lytic transglycosylase RlpA family protein [Limimonas halophila]SDF74463.1 rare lipoprotein A [Limimonas halophila]